MAIDQIKQRKQENPDDINEVPVQTYVFNGGVVIFVEAALPGYQDEPQEQTGADDHVQGVQTGHAEIERKIKLRVRIESNGAAFAFDSFSDFLGFIGKLFALQA